MVYSTFSALFCLYFLVVGWQDYFNETGGNMVDWRALSQFKRFLTCNAGDLTHYKLQENRREYRPKGATSRAWGELRYYAAHSLDDRQWIKWCNKRVPWLVTLLRPLGETLFLVLAPLELLQLLNTMLGERPKEKQLVVPGPKAVFPMPLKFD